VIAGRIAIAIAAVASCAGLGACVLIRSDGARVDRQALLRDVTEQVIVPGYAELADRAHDLDSAQRALCERPDPERLDTARAELARTSEAWAATLGYGFGPVVDLHLEGQIDFWPARAATVEANVASSEPITDDWVDGLGTAGKGLHAIELLLFAGGEAIDGAPGDDAALAALAASERRCGYLVALGAHLSRSTIRARSAWERSWAEQLVTAGRGSSGYATEADGVSAIVTELVGAVQRVDRTQLESPLGLAEGGSPSPDAVALRLSQRSIASMVATLDGVRAVWDHGLDPAVRSRDPRLADRVAAELEAALAALAAIPEPFAEYVVSGDLAAGRAAIDALRVLARSLATEVSVALAITVGFTDNDGD
jgi:predicted lipoprotein